MESYLNKIQKRPAPLSPTEVRSAINEPRGTFEIPVQTFNKMNLGDRSYFELRKVSASSIVFYELHRGQFFHSILPGKKLWHNQRVEQKETLSKTFGSTLHKALLEKERFDLAKDTFFSILPGKERTILKTCLDKIEKNKNFKTFLEGNKREKIFTFEHETSKGKIPCKTKIDLLNLKNWLVEIKSIDKLENIYKSFDNYRYDIQLSFYLESAQKNGEDVEGVAIFAIEKTPPYDSHIFIVSKEKLNRGKNGDNYFRGWKEIIEEMYFNPKKRFEKSFSTL